MRLSSGASTRRIWHIGLRRPLVRWQTVIANARSEYDTGYLHYAMLLTAGLIAEPLLCCGHLLLKQYGEVGLHARTRYPDAA